MTKLHSNLRWLPLLCSMLGCGVVWVREPGPYQEELVELVEPSAGPVQACYEELLASAQLALEVAERQAQGPYEDIGPAVTEGVKQLSGTVVVQFTVAPKTGVVATQVNTTRTTAPPEVAACVEKAIQGLVIDPGDEREGRAVMAFELTVGRHGTRRTAAASTPPGED